MGSDPKCPECFDTGCCCGGIGLSCYGCCDCPEGQELIHGRYDKRLDAMRHTEAQRLMEGIAELIPLLQNSSGQAGLLAGFLSQDRETQQSIIGAFVQLLVDWRKGKKEDLVDERNKAAWGLASLVSEI